MSCESRRGGAALWHSAATDSRQDDGDGGLLVYLCVPGNICQSCCLVECVLVNVWCREIKRIYLLSHLLPVVLV